jgi:predicted  nucleic acid-binding Zn-ribbon protein
MPHECTDCGRAFADGSKEMLSGCPNCGGTTFQFRPAGSEPAGRPDEPPDGPEADADRVARTVGNAASAVRNLVTGDSTPAGPPERDQSGSETTASEAAGTAESGESATAAATESEDSDGSVAATESEDSDGSVAVTESEDSDGSVAVTEEDDSPTGEVTVPSTPEWPGAGDTGTESDDGQQDTTTRQAEPTQSDTPDDIVEADEIPDASAGQRDRPPVPDPRPLSARPEKNEESGADTESGDNEESGADTESGDNEESGADTESGDNEESTPADVAEEVTAGDSDERPSLSELRAELNDQFESIRVVEPGQYELNLMELYDREEYIVALQEDGKYTIQLPERWDER